MRKVTPPASKPPPPPTQPDKQLEAEVKEATRAAPCGAQGREAHRTSFMWD